MVSRSSRQINWNVFLQNYDENKVIKYLGRPDKLKKKIDKFIEEMCYLIVNRLINNESSALYRYRELIINIL